MPSVQFTSHLRHVVPTVPMTVQGITLRGVLDEIFTAHPKARSYVLDDQDRLRKHVVIFVDGDRVQPGDDLRQNLRSDSKVFVLQALSGG
jgi:hypothetical protein